ncbi:methyltransferase domain-containing protein [Candidatus Zixiibacteriota bacterium]
MALLRKIARCMLRRTAGNRRIREVTAFLAEVQCGTLPASITPDRGAFIDSSGNRITLFSGMRDWLKPEWRSMFDSESGNRESGPLVPETAAHASRESVEKALRFLDTAGISLEGKKVAEIGCYDGTRSFALAGLGAEEVIATDIPEYYLHQKEHTSLSDEEIEAGRQLQVRRFNSGAEVCKRIFGWPDLEDRVSFREDDICASGLPGEEYDLVVSWEVLEHVEHPARLFQSIARILKPGGVSFHEYNPFFSINGGHSLCTLDFPWGHARLSTGDFARYMNTFRPREEEVALRFFTRNLNRMSHDDMRRSVKEAGLELVTFLPWYDPCDERLLDRDILSSVQALYPSVAAEDMLARNVWVLLRKPDSIC